MHGTASSPSCFIHPSISISLTSLQDNNSHFHESVNHWRELNLSPSFVKFANASDSLSVSMPLLLHNWRAIVDLWVEAIDAADDEGLKALLE